MLALLSPLFAWNTQKKLRQFCRLFSLLQLLRVRYVAAVISVRDASTIFQWHSYIAECIFIIVQRFSIELEGVKMSTFKPCCWLAWWSSECDSNCRAVGEFGERSYPTVMSRITWTHSRQVLRNVASRWFPSFSRLPLQLILICAICLVGSICQMKLIKYVDVEGNMWPYAPLLEQRGRVSAWEENILPGNGIVPLCQIICNNNWPITQAPLRLVFTSDGVGVGVGVVVGVIRELVT